MITRRQARQLVTLLTVLGVHVAVVWLLVSSQQRWVRAKSGSLQLVWIPRAPLSEAIPDRGTTRQTPRPRVPHRRDRTIDAPSSVPPPGDEASSAISPAPDWGEELKRAAKDALAKELERKKHEFDFAHAYPRQPNKPPQFAWDYAATHRVETMPQGGIVIHLNDNCVLLIIPLPFAICSIGKHPANGNLFEHLHDP